MIILRSFIGMCGTSIMYDAYIAGDYVMLLGDYYHITKLNNFKDGDSVLSDINKYRLLVAHRGNATIPEDWELLLALDYPVRGLVACSGIKKYLDILVNDDSYFVKSIVAKYGSDTHRDILVTDDDEYVRLNVAIFGNRSHLELLTNDENNMVNKLAKRRISEYNNRGTL